MSEDSTMVHVVSGRKVYHTDTDCDGLAVAKDSRTAPLAAMEGFRRECKICSEDYERDRKGDTEPRPARTFRAGEVTEREETLHVGHVWTRDGFRRPRTEDGNLWEESRGDSRAYQELPEKEGEA